MRVREGLSVFAPRVTSLIHIRPHQRTVFQHRLSKAAHKRGKDMIPKRPNELQWGGFCKAGSDKRNIEQPRTHCAVLQNGTTRNITQTASREHTQNQVLADTRQPVQ